MSWPWGYLRRKAADSLLAGFYDALAAGGAHSGLSEEQAANAARTIFGAPDGPAPEGTPTPTPPQLPGPSPTGQVAQGDPPRRPRGRPRKHQEPPQ